MASAWQVSTLSWFCYLSHITFISNLTEQPTIHSLITQKNKQTLQKSVTCQVVCRTRWWIRPFHGCWHSHFLPPGCLSPSGWILSPAPPPEPQVWRSTDSSSIKGSYQYFAGISCFLNLFSPAVLAGSSSQCTASQGIKVGRFTQRPWGHREPLTGGGGAQTADRPVQTALTEARGFEGSPRICNCRV